MKIMNKFCLNVGSKVPHAHSNMQLINQSQTSPSMIHTSQKHFPHTKQKLGRTLLARSQKRVRPGNNLTGEWLQMAGRADTINEFVYLVKIPSFSLSPIFLSQLSLVLLILQVSFQLNYVGVKVMFAQVMGIGKECDTKVCWKKCSVQ